MNTKFVLTIILSAAVLPAAAQRPRHPDGPPPDGRRPHHDWTRAIDTNNNGVVEADEFQAAIDRTFAEIDRNNNGTIDKNEAPPPHPPGDRTGEPGDRPPMPGMDGGRPGPPPARPGEGFGERQGPPGEHMNLLPPFFFEDKLEQSGTLTKADFERAAKDVFASMDANHDGMLSREESKPPRDHHGGPDGPPPPPHAMFIAAELRFGDKLVKNQPFSADIVIEDTRRLFDGSTVTKKMQGSIYRDAAGRTRREQPLDAVGGFTIDKPKTLVFINDFAANSQYFLDLDAKTARTNRIGQGRPPREGEGPPDGKTESLGTRTIEGVTVEGTRITSEIPAGDLGNDKPIQVVTENWISPELQMIVMSRHIDPLSGEHVFRMINIKRSEPSASLFTVPAGFKVEGPREGEK